MLILTSDIFVLEDNDKFYNVDPVYFIATFCLSFVELGHARDRQTDGRTDR